LRAQTARLISTGRRAPRRSRTQLREEEAMKANYKIAAAMIGSFALGVGAASVLHAQAKPPAYLFAENDVKDMEGYKKDFLPPTQANMKEFGAKYLGGGGPDKTMAIYGDQPKTRIVLVQFPDMDTLKAFFAKQKPTDEMGLKYVSAPLKL
jgi:uncharacterized protein (DUF1330 family)